MRPELPDYGTFPRWPAEGSDWIHPDDLETVMHLVPSERVFRREQFDGEFYHYRYGDIHFRLKPCMWLPLENEGVDIGDLVETTGLAMERELFIAHVSEALFAPDEGRCVYRLSRVELTDDRLYGCDEFRVLTDKTKLQLGDTLHPEPRWVEKFHGAEFSGERLHLPPDVEADDGTDKQT